MMIYVAFFLLICMVLVWVTISGRDAFPFSYYPMFSGLKKIQEVKVIRIRLESSDGKIEWWETEFYRYPEFVGKKMKVLYNHDQGKAGIFYELEKKRLLNEVLRLIADEKGAKNTYTSFHIVERTIGVDLRIQDKILEVIPFSRLKNG
jgi:hypothetical protein